MGSRGDGLYIEYSAEELEKLKFIAEVTPFQDMEALSVIDYLNHEHAGYYMGIALSINEKEGTDNQTTQGSLGPEDLKLADSVAPAEASDKNADEKVIIAKSDQSENVEDTTAQKEEDTLVLAETSDKIVDEKTIIVEPTHQAQNAKDSSTERDKEDVNGVNESSVKEDEPVEATHDENRNDQMALMIVPLDQGQYIGQSSTEKASIGENYQAQEISVISRIISRLPLHLRLKGWKIREHPRRVLNRKDKFYIHLQSKVQFRSLNEVDDFVHLGFHPKRQTKKLLLVDPQNSGLQAPKEGPPAKRSIRRVLAWEFYNRKFMRDGTIICDIRFPGSSLGIIEYHNIGSRALSQDTGSSEETISDRSVNSKGWEELRKEKEEEEEEEVQTPFVEALENFMNVKPDDDNDHDPPPPPPPPSPSPRQQMNNEAEAQAQAQAQASSSSKPNSTSTGPGTLAGGKRTKDNEYAPEEGPISNKPRASIITA